MKIKNIYTIALIIGLSTHLFHTTVAKMTGNLLVTMNGMGILTDATFNDKKKALEKSGWQKGNESEQEYNTRILRFIIDSVIFSQYVAKKGIDELPEYITEYEKIEENNRDSWEQIWLKTRDLNGEFFLNDILREKGTMNPSALQYTLRKKIEQLQVEYNIAINQETLQSLSR